MKKTFRLFLPSARETWKIHFNGERFNPAWFGRNAEQIRDGKSWFRKNGKKKKKLKDPCYCPAFFPLHRLIRLTVIDRVIVLERVSSKWIKPTVCHFALLSVNRVSVEISLETLRNSVPGKFLRATILQSLLLARRCALRTLRIILIVIRILNLRRGKMEQLELTIKLVVNLNIIWKYSMLSYSLRHGDS